MKPPNARTARSEVLLFSNASDTGRVREKNEDFLGYSRSGERQLFIVADGMGGEAGGQVASRTAVAEAQRTFEETPNADPPALLRAAVKAAAAACSAIQRENAELRDMGTTLDLLLVEGTLAWCAHVGDSRIYRIRQGRAERITKDHTRVQQMLDAGFITAEDAAEHPHRNVLSRAVGRGEGAEPDVSADPIRLEDGDALLMCTDGLYDLVTDVEIAFVADRYGPQRGCRKLVDLANSRGGSDNVTVQIVYSGKPRRSWSKVATAVPFPRPGPAASRARRVGIGSLAVFLAAMALAWWAVRRYTTASAPAAEPAKASIVRRGLKSKQENAARGGSPAVDDRDRKAAPKATAEETSRSAKESGGPTTSSAISEEHDSTKSGAGDIEPPENTKAKAKHKTQVPPGAGPVPKRAATARPGPHR